MYDLDKFDDVVRTIEEEARRNAVEGVGIVWSSIHIHKVTGTH